MAPPLTPPPWVWPLAAKGKGDRVSWAQLQGDRVGALPSFLGKAGDGVPGLDQALERTLVWRHWSRVGGEVQSPCGEMLSSQGHSCCDKLGGSWGQGIFSNGRVLAGLRPFS